MIPKKIHFIWLGPNKRNNLIEKCIASWYTFHPDWEIIEWTDSDFNYDDCEFVKVAFENKNWAYLSDYYRLKLLYLHGGIYLDTDMLLIKPLEPLLSNEIFWGYEEEHIVSCGIIGTEKGNSFIKSILDYYNSLTAETWQIHTIPQIVTQLYDTGSFKNVTIYPRDFFYPYPAESRLKELTINYKRHITPNTIGIHMWEFSWSYFSRYQLFLKNRQLLNAVLCFVKEAFTSRKTFRWKELKKTFRIILRR